MVVQEMASQTEKAAEELNQKGLEKRINLKDPGDVLTANKPGEDSKGNTEVNPKYAHLTDKDKDQLEEKLSALKKNIADCLEYSEEGIYYKAEELLDLADLRAKNDPDNKYLARIVDKLRALKDNLNSSDRNKNNNIENLVKDITNAHEKEMETYEKKPEKKAELKAEDGKHQELDQLGENYGNLKTTVKNAYLNMIKNTEEAIKKPTLSKLDDIKNAKEIDFGEDSFLNQSLYNSEADLRRKRKLKDKSFSNVTNNLELDNFEDDDNSEFSYKQFTENSSLIKLIDDFDKKKNKDEGGKARLTERKEEKMPGTILKDESSVSEDPLHDDKIYWKQKQKDEEERLAREAAEAEEIRRLESVKENLRLKELQMIEDEQRRQKELEKLIAELERQKKMDRSDLDGVAETTSIAPSELDRQEMERLREKRRLGTITPEELRRLEELERAELEYLKDKRKKGTITPEELRRLEQLEREEYERLNEKRKLGTITPEELERLIELENAEIARLKEKWRLGTISPEEMMRLEQLEKSQMERLKEKQRNGAITPEELRKLEELENSEWRRLRDKKMRKNITPEEVKRLEELERSLLARLREKKRMGQITPEELKWLEELEKEEMEKLKEKRRLGTITPEELERLEKMEREEYQKLLEKKRLGTITPEELRRLQELERMELDRLREKRKLGTITPEEMERLIELQRSEMEYLRERERLGMLTPEEMLRLEVLEIDELEYLRNKLRNGTITPEELERLNKLEKADEERRLRNMVHEAIKPSNNEITAVLQGISLKRKLFFQEGIKIVEGVEIPTVLEVSEIVKRKYRSDTPESQKSHQDHCDPTQDPCESFYEEVTPEMLVDKDKIAELKTKPLYKRKIRKLNPHELDKNAKERAKEEEMKKKKNMVMTSKLEKVDEWSKGKKILKQRKDFVKVKKLGVPDYLENEVAYLKVVGKDPETLNPVFVKDEGKERTKNIEPEEAEELARGPTKYTILKGSGQMYKIMKIIDPEENKLIKVNGYDPENPAIRMYEKYPDPVNGLPLYEEDKNKFLDKNAPECAKNERLELAIKAIESKPYFETADLVKFLNEIKNSPQLGIEFHQEDAKELNEKKVSVEAAPEDILDLKDPAMLKVIQDLIKSKQIDPFSSRKKKSLIARRLSKRMNDKTMFMGEPSEEIDQDENKLKEEEEDDEDNPIDELKKALKNTKNAGDLQGIFNKLVDQIVKNNDEVDKQNRLLDELFKEYRDEMKKRNEPFYDVFFSKNSSSMVNNSIKSPADYKNIGWEKLSNIYEFPSLLVNFEPLDLFKRGDTTSILLNFALASMCDYPNRIKKIFSSHDQGAEGMFGVKLHNSGKLENVLLDEYIPYDKEKGPFVVTPTNQKEGEFVNEAEEKINRQMSSGKKTKRRRNLQNEVDLWPHILCKALAKLLGCYERLLIQPIASILVDISGMPVKTYSSTGLDFAFLRQCYKRQFITIAKAKGQWISEAKKTRTCESSDKEIEHWIINQVVQTSEEEHWIEVKNHFCPNGKETDWRSDQYLKISEDWMKYKRYKKREKGTYWIPFEKLESMFEEIVVCKYQDDYHIVTQQFESKYDNPFGCEVRIDKTTLVNFSVVQMDKISAPKGYEYTTLRTFISQQFNDYDVGIGKQHSLIRASHHDPSRTVAVEVKLEPGLYKFVADVESPEPENPRAHNMIIYSDEKINLKALSMVETHRIAKEIISNLAVQRGERSSINDDNSLRKYIFEAKKLGIYVITYVNKSTSFYNMVEKLKITGSYSISKPLEDNDKIMYQLPMNTKKYVLFRFHPLHNFKIEVLESTYKIKHS